MPRSVYGTLPGVEVYDLVRDAWSFSGGMPVVAHPPCRLWGRMRGLAKCPDAEKEKALGLFCAVRVRESGGILEHPARSLLWTAANLPTPGRRDEFGGWTLAAPQWWWGHKADKASWFYIVGVEPADLPEIPLRLGESDYVVATIARYPREHPEHRIELSKRLRSATPSSLANWLLSVARLSSVTEAGL
ncbi:MAG: hypothetical protein PHE83_09345 [Opitutaceae bacterium]|nr:hypothetical protein [Opitutaceae bacterium]